MSGCGSHRADHRCAFLKWAGARGLPRSVCRRVMGLWRPNRYRRGDVLFYEGNEPLSLYFLCEGMVKLVRTEGTGRRHILRVITGADLLGERALLAGQSYAASAEVMEDSEICALGAARFRELWRTDPELPRMFARHLALRLAEADEAACDLALCTVRELLSKVIARKLEAAQGGAVRFSESRQELADLLGTSPEVVSRTLSGLARKGLIVLDGRSLKVRDKARLLAAARLPGPGAGLPARDDFYQGVSRLSSYPAGRSLSHDGATTRKS